MRTDKEFEKMGEEFKKIGGTVTWIVKVVIVLYMLALVAVGTMLAAALCFLVSCFVSG